MKVIAGLGNPGKRYENTRHNVGFLVLDKLKIDLSNLASNLDFKYSKNAQADYCSVKIDGETIELIKPQTFMNNSGSSLKYARDKHKVNLDDIFVIIDDLDIPFGEYKIQKGKGPKDHNGLNSIYDKLGSKDFWHVRVGINNSETRSLENNKRIPGEDYVLMNFTQDEKDVLNSVVQKIVDEISGYLHKV